MGTLRLATRGSPLAKRQSEMVVEALQATHPELAVEVVVVRTSGDDLTLSLDAIGGQGVFVTEVEAAVADGRADLAVHSAKDMTSVMVPHLVLAAVLPRGDARDGLVGCTVADLPAGGVIATGSARRRAQLAYLRPDLSFTEVRGNMERRVSHGEDGSVSAVVVAVAAMHRLGWADRLTDIIDPMVMLPQAGQGAIAIQCRADDEATRALLSAIDDEPSHCCLRAERAVLAHVGGSCTVPVAAWATVAEATGELLVRGLVASGDGRTMVRLQRAGQDPEVVGAEVAHTLMTEGGGSAIDGFGEVGPVGDAVLVTVYLVGAGPGDPGLLTRRGAELLAQADVVIYDRLVHRSVLAIAPESAELIDVGKRPGAADGHRRQEQINQLLIEHGRRARYVVRLKGGDPFLFGRGGEEVEVLSQAGIPWEVVPGVTSAFGAAAAAGIPVTHRGLASSVTVVTGRVGDSSSPAGVDWETLAKVDGTLVILMGMASRADIAQALQRGGKDPATPVAVIEKGSTPAQRIVRTSLNGLAEVSLGSPAIIVIGPVAAMGVETSPSDAGALAGRTIVITRPGARAKSLVDALEFEGARVIEMPLTAQVPPADDGVALRAEAARVGHYQWVIFTSVNGVDATMAELRDARAFGSVQVAAVGPATADALRRAGIEPDLVPSDHSADALVEMFPSHTGTAPAGALFPSADIAPSTIADGLGEKGWDVTRVDAYRTVDLPSPAPEVLAEVARADAVTFTATSSVQAYLALRTPEDSALAAPPCVVCIGASTAERARSLGLAGVIEAHSASTAGIVATLVEYFAEHDRVGS